VRAIGVHVCEGCGLLYETIGDYLNCVESHIAFDELLNEALDSESARE